MNTKKKAVSIALAACIAAVAVAGTTMAYLTDKADAKNVMTIGKVDITLTEPNWTATGEKEAADLYPGEAVAKDPTVENVGQNPAFVRIKLEMPESVQFTFRTDYQDGISKDWEEYEGYYYYKAVLPAGETADALFDQVVLDPNTTNAVAGEKAQINVFAEAVQAQGAKVKFEDVEKMTVAEIAAWFTTCGMDSTL